MLAMGSLTFDVPAWLLLLPLALAYLIWLQRTTLSPLPRWREWSTMGLRVIGVILLIFALAGARWTQEIDELVVLFCVDWSDSVAEEGRQRALDFVNESIRKMGDKDKAGVIVFARDAYMERAAKRDLERLEGIRTQLVDRTGFTNIARAISFALEAFPARARKRIVLVSDGNQNRGDAAAKAIVARTKGVELVTVTIDPKLEREVMLEGLDLPSFVRKDEPFSVRVRMRAYKDGQGTLDIFRNGELVESKRVSYRAGAQTIEIEQRIDDEAFVRYEATLRDVADNDSITDNNKAQGFVRVLERSRVLLIEGNRAGAGGTDRARYLADALKEGGIHVTVRGTGGLPTSRAELNRYDAVILSDEPAPRSRALMAQLRDYVRLSGGGLLMLGGRDSFGVGGYHKTPVEEALPLSMDVRKKRFVASIAIMIVIDNSGSMSFKVGNRTKLSLAIDGAIETLNLLRSRDQLGVHLVDTDTFKLQPLQQIGEQKATITRKLRQARVGGGGIYAREGLQDAYKALLATRAMVKHVILFADGSDTENQSGCLDMARRHFQRDRITCSTISLGEAGDTDFLRRLGRAGGGQFYLAKTATVLPRIFTKDTMIVSRNALVESPVVPKRIGYATMLEGIEWGSAPALDGYNLTTVKERAELLLAADRKVDWGDGKVERVRDAVLARWRYGLGKAVAFTSDAKNRWGARWVKWKGFKPFWVQTVRWAMRQEAYGQFGKQLVIRGTEGVITVDAKDEQDRLYHGLELEAVVQPPGGKAKPTTVKLREVGPGQYEGRFQASEDGAYLASIKQRREGGEQLVGVVGGVRTYADEFRRLEPDPFTLQRLARLGGGFVANDASRIFEHGEDPVTDSREIWPWLLTLALLLFFLDICTRRLVLPERAAAAAETLVAKATPMLASIKRRAWAARKVKIDAVGAPEPLEPEPGEDEPSVRGPVRIESREMDAIPQVDEDALADRLAAARRRAKQRRGE